MDENRPKPMPHRDSGDSPSMPFVENTRPVDRNQIKIKMEPCGISPRESTPKPANESLSEVSDQGKDDGDQNEDHTLSVDQNCNNNRLSVENHEDISLPQQDNQNNNESRPAFSVSAGKDPRSFTERDHNLSVISELKTGARNENRSFHVCVEESVPRQVDNTPCRERELENCDSRITERTLTETDNDSLLRNRDHLQQKSDVCTQNIFHRNPSEGQRQKSFKHVDNQCDRLITESFIVSESGNIHTSHDFSGQSVHLNPHLSDPSAIFAQVDTNYAYSSLPAMETLAETAMSQMSADQQLAVAEAHRQMSQHSAVGRPVNVAWNQCGQADASFECPLPNSSHEVPDRMLQQITSRYDTDNCIQQRYQHNQSQEWYGQEHYEHNQTRWMSCNRNAGIQYVHNMGDRNWNANPEFSGRGQSEIQKTPDQGYLCPQSRLHKTTPTDMSPTATPSHQLFSRMASSESSQDSARRQVKRSISSRGYTYVPLPKAPKMCASTSENFQISTNVHTLKPRHMVSWYIDHLIQENENITQISNSYTVPVNIYQSKDMYFMEALMKKMNFPTPRFLNWMQNNFPNINIHAVDFSEGRKSNFKIVPEDICSMQRSEIIKDTFYYFQKQQSPA